MFILRGFFWLRGILLLVVILLLLPAQPRESVHHVPEYAREQGLEAPEPRSPSPGELVHAARSVIDDLSGFCVRSPDACDTGFEIGDILLRKAHYAFNTIVAMINNSQTPEESSGHGTLTDDDIHLNGNVDTLKLDDHRPR